ncbi:hypothetical protein ULG90_07040 [Halopseudomonas pachastrellae]|nr:hypothetical protein ULG90_07040 [Halopseudomonas pachastrellae]
MIGFGLLTLTALIIACSDIPEYPHSEPVVAPQQSFAYQRDIKPILENRCMACHGCYDAPCQLKLTSADGVKRGASQLQVYDAARLEYAPDPPWNRRPKRSPVARAGFFLGAARCR